MVQINICYYDINPLEVCPSILNLKFNYGEWISIVINGVKGIEFVSLMILWKIPNKYS